jgi:adenylate cyclase
MRLGRIDDARAEVAEILRLDPGYTLADLSERLPFRYPEDREHYLADLRRAGVPEG